MEEGEGTTIVSVDSTSLPQIVAVESTLEEETPALVDSPPSDGDDQDQRPQEKSPSPATAAPAVPDAAEIKAKIIKQVEFYFSDENLPTDKYLMKHVRKDKAGFIPISIIASFRKMKKITKDISVIVDALKDSSQLVVSPDGKKVKRLHPLPSNETRDPKVKRQNPLPSNEPRDPKLCTVVVENLPQDHSSENIQRIFGGVGSVKSVSVHDPNAAEDGDQSKRVEKVISGKIYALVEYETVEAAEKAVSTLNDETDWRNGLRVQLLSKRAVYGRKAWRDPDAEKGNHARVPVPVGDENNNHMNQQHGNVSGDEDEEHTAKERNGRKGRNRSKGRKYHGNNHGMGHGCAILEPSKPPPGPRMPDGTRGFTMGRGRPLSTSV